MQRRTLTDGYLAAGGQYGDIPNVGQARAHGAGRVALAAQARRTQRLA